MAKTSPTDARLEAVGAITRRFKIEDFRPVGLIPVAELTEAIRPLAALGRTDRWKNGVEGWALLIEQEGATPEGRSWALTQGAIFCAREA